MDKFGQHDLPSGLLGRLSGGADAFDEGTAGPILLADYFEAAASGTDNLTATGITTGSPTLSSPALTQLHALLAVGLSTGTPTLGSPALTQLHALLALGISTDLPSLGSPALGGDTPQPPPPEINTGGAWSWRAQRFEPRVEALFARSLLTAPPTLGRPELAVRLGPEQQRRLRAALIAALH